MEDGRIRIPLTDNMALVAEKGLDGDYKEIYIGIEKDGIWYQDLAFVRECYHYGDRQDEKGSETIPEHGKYEVAVYADDSQEDYTDIFRIREYEE